MEKKINQRQKGFRENKEILSGLRIETEMVEPKLKAESLKVWKDWWMAVTATELYLEPHVAERPLDMCRLAFFFSWMHHFIISWTVHIHTPLPDTEAFLPCLRSRYATLKSRASSTLRILPPFLPSLIFNNAKMATCRSFWDYSFKQDSSEGKEWS